MSDLESAAKRKRVNRLKKLILLLLVTLLVVPIVMCTVMFVRMVSMENELHELNSRIEQLAFEQSKWQQNIAAETDATDSSTDCPDKQAEGQLPDLSDGIVQNEPGVSGEGEGEASAEDTQTVLVQSDLVVKNPADKEYNPEADENIRKVYLTFDDGPSENTDEILDILAQYNVKATFFLVGKQGEMAENAMRRIVEEGHTIGMHTYSHRYSQIYASKEAFVADFLQLQDYIYRVTGVRSTYYRFPGGSSNEVSDVDILQLIDWVHEQGIEYYDWNSSGDDALSVNYDAQDIVENCMRNMENYNSVVVLLHDANNKDATVEALPLLIQEIQAMENTVILPITEYTVPVQHITTKETEE